MAAPDVQPLPGGACFCEEQTDDSRQLGDGVLDGTSDTLEKRGQIQKIMRRGQADFVSELVEIRGKSKNAFARETRKQQDRRGRKIEWKVVEDAVWFVCRTHQLIEAFRGAGEHVSEISQVEANAFRLAGSTGSIDDGDDIAVLATIV